MSQIIKPVMLDETGQAIGEKLDDTKQMTSARLTELIGRLQTIAEAIEAVHSVNGMDGDVVIDASTIQTNKLDPNSKTISQLLSEEQTLVNNVISEIQAAIGRTPVSFSASQIEDEDYLLTITLGTP